MTTKDFAKMMGGIVVGLGSEVKEDYERCSMLSEDFEF